MRIGRRMQIHEVPKEVTVQKICKVCRGEKQVREILDEIWRTPEQSKEIINEVLERNKDIFEFEKILNNVRSGKLQKFYDTLQ